MKKLILVAALAFALPFFATAQVQINQLPSIDVNMSCDTLVTADRFELSITLTDNKGAGKAGLEEAEKKTLIPILKNAGIDVKKDLAISNINSYYDKKETVATKNYTLKVNSVATLNEITSKLTNANIISSVTSATVSNAKEIESQLRAKAIKATREQSESLLSAVNCHIGKLLKVNFSGSTAGPQARTSGYVMMAKSVSNDSMDDAIDSYKKVRLSVYLGATYEIINK